MKLKKSLFSLLALGVFLAPLSADVDFEWRLGLNNRYQADPYEYRYDLSQRFRLPESRVISILREVREPSDAYMIFRLAELSEKPYDYVLTVYRQNRYASWLEIARLLGIRVDSSEFNALRHQHDLRDDYHYDSRRYDHRDDRGIIIKREEIYIPQGYQGDPRKYRDRDDEYRDEERRR